MAELQTMGTPDRVPELDPDEAAVAVRMVCANATDAADARELLDALGLTPTAAHLAHLRALGRGDQPPEPDA